MERRQFARIKTDLHLKFKSLEFLEGLIDARAADVSMGGIFIKTSTVREVGTVVEIELPVPDCCTVMIKGVIRSIRYKDGKPCGLGIEFQNLTSDAEATLRYLVNKEDEPKSAAQL